MGACFVGYTIGIPHRREVPEGTIDELRGFLVRKLCALETMRRICWEFLPKTGLEGPEEQGWVLFRERGPGSQLLFEYLTVESVLPGGQFREAYLRLCADPSVRGQFVSLDRDGTVVQPEDATAPFLEKCLCVLGEVEKAGLLLAYRWHCDERTTIEGVVERVLEWVHRLDQLDVDTTYAVCTRLKAQKVLTVGSFQYDGDPPMSSEYAVLNLLVNVPGVLERLGWEA